MMPNQALQGTMNIGAVVLDLDGVILKTNFVKHSTMLSLFADHPEKCQAISDFILANGGVPRRAKLAHLLEHYLRLKPTAELLSNYLDRYAIELEQRLAAAPMVEGVKKFVARSLTPIYICSSAPELEVHEQVARRNIGRHFAAVYAGNTPKAEALRAIAARYPGQSVVFFGDSVGDFEAARKAAVAFVGVTCERDNFRAMPVVKVLDFADAIAVEQAMVLAVSKNAT